MEENLDEDLVDSLYKRVDFDHLKVITPWAEVFGKDNVIVRCFEDIQREHRAGAYRKAPCGRLSRPPDEIVIADGGSTDRTVEIIRSAAQDGLPVRLVMAPGTNISQARNRAIAAAASDIIACTDAGCQAQARCPQRH